MQFPTHAHCDQCDAIRPVTLEPLDQADTSGRYLGGDVVCDVCGFIIATMYEPAGVAREREASEVAREGEAGRAPADPV